MNYVVMIGVVAVLTGLRFARANTLAWLVAWWVGVYVACRFGVRPPLPSSIIVLFMAIITGALLTYLLSDSQRLESTKRPLIAFLVERKYTVPLIAAAVAIPLLVAFKVYLGMSREVTPPQSGRTIHPAPPESITFQGKTIDLIAGVNPYRALETSAPDSFRVHLQDGRRVYYQNCVFCHGDNMEGDGIFAHALDPIPANFAEPTTIAMLQETYLFWRISKGGPGLPEESTPWSSAMPAWEQFLTEDEVWDVILFLYDHTGQKPRAREAAE